MRSATTTTCRITVLAMGLYLTGATPLGAQTILDRLGGGDTAAVRTLLADDPGFVHATDENGATALHHAAARGYVEVVDVLLRAGAAVDAREQDDETPLHYAAWRRRVEVGRLLVAGGADLEARNRWGRTPLLIAARETGHVETARLLIDAGADVNARDRGEQSSLDLAAWRGFADFVNLLLDHDAELPPPSSRNAQLLTMSAADKGLDRLFERCVRSGVDLGLRNESDGSLLHSASQGGSAAIVSRLLRDGFDPNGRDRYGRTPLHYAAEMDKAAVARALLAGGADIDARSLSGETPLHTAQAIERDAMTRLLLDAGALPEPRRFPQLTGAYFGQHPPAPDDGPTLFAPDIVSTHRFQHGTIVFSPAGDEAFWSSQIALHETGYSQGMLLVAHIENGRWTAPAPAPFSQLGLGDDVPTYAPDGARVYFLSVRRAPGEEESPGERIWYVVRTASGWSEPRLIEGGPNTIELHWSFSVAADGSVYVASRGDLYVSRFVDGRYADPEHLGPHLNSNANESMPFIAPDGSYLLFTRFRHPDNHGFADLWISFPEADGDWGEPVNLGERVNAIGGICPTVTPDGRYLFFNSGNDDNYWIDAGIIEAVRP
jgi:ankyrin repeat protein